MSITLRYGDLPRVLAITCETTAPRTSASGRYITAHLPKAENPAKLQISYNDEPCQITILHDLDVGGAAVELCITAGASAYDVSLSIDLDGRTAGAHGVTGATVAASVPA